jgi:hypothetical protein
MIAIKWRHDRSESLEILAGIYNVNRDPKKQRKPFRAYQLNPYISDYEKKQIGKQIAKREEETSKKTRVNIKDLKPLFMAMGYKESGGPPELPDDDKNDKE